MTLFGCGPKLALLCLPYILLSVAVMYFYPEFLNLKFLDVIYIRIIGFLWLGTGLLFWIYSAVYFVIHFKPGVLIPGGYGDLIFTQGPQLRLLSYTATAAGFLYR